MKVYLVVAFLIVSTFTSQSQNSFCAYAKRDVIATSFASPSDVSKMNNYDIYFYKLDVDVENNSTYISGNVSIYAKAVKSFSEFVFELHDSLHIDSVIINSSKKTFTRNNGVVTAVLGNSISASSTVQAIIYYRGNTPQDNSSAIGNGFSNDPSLKVTWSLSESFVAYEWFPCKQVLYDKADSSEVWITTDQANKAGSNGLLKNITTLPNGKKRHEWKSHFPIDYYLISVSVAKYFEYNLYAHPAGSDSILIQNYLYDSAVIPAVNNTPAMIEMYSKIIGLYPFASEKYGHCMAPINGGMEHQTMTTLGPSSAYTFDIITHELAHQWFGDLVTCGTWADIWLNEGFASYFEYVSNDRLLTGNSTSWMTNAMAGAKYAWGWVYVNDTLNTNTIFNPYASYKKGAVILHMLRYEMNNDSLFFLGIRNYLNTYKFSTAVSKDFQKVMEQTSGKNLDYFFSEWLHGLGYPVFSAKYNVFNNNLYVNLTQTTTNASTPLFKTTIDIRVIFNNGDTVMRVWVDSLSKVFVTNVSGKNVKGIQLDVKNWILKDIGTISYDPTFNAIESLDGDKSNILVYPNPANDRINLSNANGCSLEMFDVSGKMILNKTVSEINSTIDVSNLVKGFYFIKIEKNGAVRNLKFVKE